MIDDATLLRRYAIDRSEGAFTELVDRHIDLVYGAALRRTGSHHAAADIAQLVFTTLARQARRLSRHSVLPAWLHTATRNASLNLMISEQRRKARESEAASMGTAASADAASLDWEGIKPVLDGAIDDLPLADREVVVLRFLERREFSEIGLALRVSTDAARMRSGRALEKLRAVLARRGIMSTAAALGAMVSSQSLVAAPAGIAATVVSASMAGGLAGAGIASSFLSIMTSKTIVVALVGCALTFGLGTYVGRDLRAAPATQAPLDNPAQARSIAALKQSNATLQSALDRVDAANVELTALNTQLNASNAKLAAAKAASAGSGKNLSIGVTPRELKMGILNNLRQVAAARDQFKLENNRDPGSVADLVGDNSYIRRLQTVGGEDYSGLSMAEGQLLTVTTPDGTTITYDSNGTATTQITDPETPSEHAQDLMKAVGPAVTQAVTAYRASNQGQNPPSPEALTPYFANPQDAVAFSQARDAVKAAQNPPH